MQAIRHDFGRERSVRRQELVADIRIEDLLVVGELRQLRVDFLDGRAKRRRRIRLALHLTPIAGKNSEDENLGLWLTLLEFFNDQAIAIHDLIDRIAVDVVGSKHQDDQLRLESFEFAILHAPQHALRRVAGDTKIRGLQRPEVGVPYFKSGGGLLSTW